nr:immunoglobulin heavy chain junction region [Mus musculus]
TATYYCARIDISTVVADY